MRCAGSQEAQLRQLFHALRMYPQLWLSCLMQPEENQDVREVFDSFKAFRPALVNVNPAISHMPYRSQDAGFPKAHGGAPRASPGPPEIAERFRGLSPGNASHFTGPHAPGADDPPTNFGGARRPPRQHISAGRGGRVGWVPRRDPPN